MKWIRLVAVGFYAKSWVSKKNVFVSISEELPAGWKAMEWGGGFRAGLMAREGGGAARWLEVHGVG